MRILERSKLSLTLTVLVMVIALCLPVAVLAIHPQVAHAAVQATSNPKSNNPVCTKNGQSVELSQGGQMFCKGPQSNGPSSSLRTSTSIASSSPSFGSNVDAASPQEDVTPSGVQIHGQSEVSVASAGPYVVEAWNDGTGFFAPCGSPMNKEELTGFGFSNNGGKTFTDLGGLPNANCATSLTFGDPSVEAYTVGGSTFFYITFCSFLDKEFLSIDPVRGRLYMSYTEFFFSFVTFTETSTVELAVCD